MNPHRDLMAEAQHEREVIDSPEGPALLEAAFAAVLSNVLALLLSPPPPSVGASRRIR